MRKYRKMPIGNNRISFAILNDAMNRASVPCGDAAKRDRQILEDTGRALRQYAAVPLTPESLNRDCSLSFHTEFTCALARFLLNLRQYGLATALEYLIESTFPVEVYRADRLEALLSTLEEAEKWVSFREENNQHGEYRHP